MALARFAFLVQHKQIVTSVTRVRILHAYLLVKSMNAIPTRG